MAAKLLRLQGVRSVRRSVVVVTALACAFAACLGPTEILLDITSNDCHDLKHVDIFVGGANTPSAVATGCANVDAGIVGTLAIVPSGGNTDRVAIAVKGSLAEGVCVEDGGCIVARRDIGYLPHRPLALPIFLDSACVGFTCPTGSTCVATNGVPACVDDHGTCSDTVNVCGIDAGIRFDAGLVDGGSEAGVDASVCISPGLLLVSKPAYRWSFDVDANEDLGAFKAGLAGSSTISNIGEEPGCASFLSANGPQQLVAQATPLLGAHPGLAFYYRTQSPLAVQLLSFGNVHVDVASTGLSVTIGNGKAQLLGNSSPAAWHAIALDFDATVGQLIAYLDGTKTIVPFTAQLSEDSLAINDNTSGGTVSVDVDQVELYSLP